MTAQLLPHGKQTFVDANGKPLAGGTIDFYEPSTTTRKTTWQDAAQTTPNTNPVVLDAVGRAVIYGFGTYRQVLKDVLGNTIWDQETNSVPVSSPGLWAGTAGGTADALQLTLQFDAELIESGGVPQAGQILSFMAAAGNTDAVDATVLWGLSSVGPHNVLKNSATGPVELVSGDIVQDNLYMMVFDDGNAAWIIRL